MDDVDVEKIIKNIDWHPDTLDAFLYGAEVIKDGYGIEAVKDLELQSVQADEFEYAEGYKRCLEFMNLCLLINRL